MEYIRAPELSSSMSTITRDSRCTFIPDLYKKGKKIGRCNKSISTFHCVTIKPHPTLKGIHDDEIEKCFQQVQTDCDSGWIVAATIGIEGEGIHRHWHARMIVESAVQSCETTKRFEPLIAKTRQVYVDKAKKENVTLKVSQPPQREMPNWRAFTHLAYPWKYMAKGYNTLNAFIEYFADCNPYCPSRFFEYRQQYRSFGLFPMDVEDRKHFATAIWVHWQKEKNKATLDYIRMDETIHDLAQVYLEETGMDVSAWKTDAVAQAKVITAMVMHKGDKQYRLDKDFFKIKGIPAGLSKKLVMSMKHPDYEALLYSAVLSATTRALGVPLVVSIPTMANSKRVKELEKELASEKREHQELATDYKDYRQRGRKRKFEAVQPRCKACKACKEGEKCDKHAWKLYDSDNEEHNYKLYRNYCDSDDDDEL